MVASILDSFHTALLWASLWDYLVRNINNITHIHEIYWQVWLSSCDISFLIPA